MTTRKLVLCSVLVIVAATVSAEPPRKAWLGLGLVLKNSPDGSKFLYVAAVPDGTPAAKAGMAAGDVVTAIDRKAIAFRDDLDLMEFMAALKPDQIVRFQVTRSGKAKSITVKAGEMPREYEERARESLERARAARTTRDARSD